mmetsp:Transcript_30064/g.68029  ORF Transcript_30064/g.68029 Transcript_30064/m.68029 type:complete len:294 (-) Transcript_30064:4483-5364(-)
MEANDDVEVVQRAPQAGSSCSSHHRVDIDVEDSVGESRGVAAGPRLLSDDGAELGVRSEPVHLNAVEGGEGTIKILVQGEHQTPASWGGAGAEVAEGRVGAEVAQVALPGGRGVEEGVAVGSVGGSAGGSAGAQSSTVSGVGCLADRLHPEADLLRHHRGPQRHVASNSRTDALAHAVVARDARPWAAEGVDHTRGQEVAVAGRQQADLVGIDQAVDGRTDVYPELRCIEAVGSLLAADGLEAKGREGGVDVLVRMQRVSSGLEKERSGLRQPCVVHQAQGIRLRVLHPPEVE